MEWIVVAADSVDAARRSALDQLGITDDELEYEVVEEPRPGLFGRKRGQYKLRARVVPSRPRDKTDRRSRRRAAGASKASRAQAADTDSNRPDAAEPKRSDASEGGSEPTGTPEAVESGPPSTSQRSPRQGASMSDISLDEQQPVALEFLKGLVDVFDVDGEVSVQTGEDDALEFRIEGEREDLGLLIGSRGSTIGAIQDLLRTAVSQQLNGRLDGRLRLDIGGYRERRREALGAFARQIADQVIASGAPRSLEPMSPPDRKVVHDTCNEIDGVRTESQGEEHRRRVVVLPD